MLYFISHKGYPSSLLGPSHQICIIQVWVYTYPIPVTFPTFYWYLFEPTGFCVGSVCNEYFLGFSVTGNFLLDISLKLLHNGAENMDCILFAHVL